ncbi:CHAT domain-containing protein [Candidatus Chloroploca sp. Khr17]|uniref:CHAT domain-containing protein n=1 Tax=Candidatus Chloroploca sp. Khr17 TaxID=2496869 RepID=UPI0013EB7DB3|nr:CHAT domain-containing protein [Candidatus Chloroploca sp. Khr17]
MLASEVPLALAPAALLAHALDPVAYGQTLTTQLFAAPALRDAWQQARALAHGTNRPLRVRLSLPADAADLHALRWETLRDPSNDLPLACDECIFLVRTLASSELRPVTLGPRPDLRTLLVVANPHDLARYHLAALEVAAEVQRVRDALGATPLTIIGDHADAVSRRATLPALHAALREAPTIFCLVAHATHTEADSVLWLEAADGTAARVPGHALSEMFSHLARPPLLAVLMACTSGGASHQAGALAALGPRLAQAGMGAVLALHDRLSLADADTFLATLWREVARDGALDRATAVARAALRDRPSWWVPALWLRMRDGYLWEASPPAATPGGVHISGSVGTVQQITVSGGNVGTIIGQQVNDRAALPPEGRTRAIAAQRTLLEAHRATLGHYLHQLALTGSAHARPEVSHGIAEARAGIARAKTALAALGAPADDHPEDTP